MEPFTLHGLVESIAREHPEAPAVLAGDERVTYGELDRMADRIAAHLAGLGVKKGDRVAMYQPKSARAVAELVGIMKAGAAYVPIDPQAPADRARFILEHCGICVVFSAGRPLKQMIKAHPSDRVLPQLIVADDVDVPATLASRVDVLAKILEAPPSSAARENVTDRELAYVLYTSGSTGAPKGVAITHGQSLSFVRTAAEIFEMTHTDVVASHAPFNFDLSVIDLFCTFAAGATVAIVPEVWLSFPARIAKLIGEAGITVWNSVPSALVQLANHSGAEPGELASLRLVMFAGEPFPLKHLRTLRALIPGARLLNVYGQTEANSSTYYEITHIPENDDAPLPVGKCFPNYDVLILGEDGQPVTRPGVEGELYVIGGAVASGYWADEERTRAAFVQHPLRRGVSHTVYKTGDRFAFDERGDLVFRGRMDSAVKVRGFRVELAELEAAATGAAGVHEAAAIALPDEAAGNVLVLFVTPASDEAALRAHLAAKVPRYMMPEVIVFERALPRTATGKIDRRALAASRGTKP